ncbi:MAG: helix-turn-helix domain-containing protein, partial [Bacillota bacterium]
MSNSSNSERQTSQSSSRLLRILEAIAENKLPVRLQDLAKQVDMTQSTVLRYLYALEDANYIYREDDTSRYALTWRVCRLGKNVDSSLSL